MACLTTNPYGIQGCTDANTYLANATTVDFSLYTNQDTGGQVFSYTAYLQMWNRSTSQWENYEIKSGSFAKNTGIFSYGISSAPAGSYRIYVRFSSSTGGGYFYANTATFILQ